MDTVLKPREPLAPDLEAGPTISASLNSPADIQLLKIGTTPNDEETVPPCTINQDYWVGEFMCFPDGETKEECQARLFALEELNKGPRSRTELHKIPN